MSKPWEDDDDEGEEVEGIEEPQAAAATANDPSASLSSRFDDDDEQVAKHATRRNVAASGSRARSSADTQHQRATATTHGRNVPSRQSSQRTGDTVGAVDKVSRNRKQHVSYMKELFPNGTTPLATATSFISLYVDMLLTIMLTVKYAAHLTVLSTIRHFAKMNTVPAFLLYVVCHSGWVFALAAPICIYAIYLTCWYIGAEWLFVLVSCLNGYAIAVLTVWVSSRFEARCRTRGLWNVLFAASVLSACWSSVLMVAYVFRYRSVVQLAFNVMYLGIGVAGLLIVALSLVNEIFVKPSSLHSGVGGDTSSMSESDVIQMHRSGKRLFAPQLTSLASCHDYALCATGLWASVPYALTSYDSVSRSGNAVPESLVNAWRRTACAPFVRLICRAVVYIIAAAAFYFDHEHVSQLMLHLNLALHGCAFTADKVLPNVSRGRSDRLRQLGLVVSEPIELSSLLDARVSQEGRAHWKKLEQLIST